LFSADFVNSVLSPLCAGDLSSELLSGSFEIVLGRGVWAEIWEWGLSCLWLSWLNTRVSEENLASNNVIAVVLNGLTFSGTVKDEKELFDKWCVYINLRNDHHIESRCLETKIARSGGAESGLKSFELWGGPLVEGAVELKLLLVESKGSLGVSERIDVFEAVFWEFWDNDSGVKGGLAVNELLSKSSDEVIDVIFCAIVADLEPHVDHSFLLGLERGKAGAVDKISHVGFLVGAFTSELISEEYIECLERVSLVNNGDSIIKFRGIFGIAIFREGWKSRGFWDGGSGGEQELHASGEGLCGLTVLSKDVKATGEFLA
jgi:hypothetical protein